ncbi:SseB protein N-terminal domain-containing protein [Frankia sp. EI5c]|uniref:SseB family protein n=1 Tax=Frankia sp. EI5c TaxID=683316 RepID=UPI0007C20448|nr:SseB family protein [Frankia sp. EI5c]OAA28297.1 SseB protein N-terminal domain-containing protein [Frankia sp. EI5c]
MTDDDARRDGDDFDRARETGADRTYPHQTRGDLTDGDLVGGDLVGGEPAGGTTRAGDALHRLARDQDDSAALGALATSDILVPDLSDPGRDNGDARVVKLPVAEQPDGRQFVPTFTSERRLADALPGVGRYRRVPLGALLRMWPSEDLMLAVDPGTEEGLTFPAEGIRALAALAD